MNITISASVGRGGINRPDDVTTIQNALNAVPVENGGPQPQLVVDRVVGAATLAAIAGFQRHHFGDRGVDGRIDPDGRTLAQLNAVLSAQPSLSTAESSTGEIVITIPVNGFVPLGAGSKLEIGTPKLGEVT